MLYAFCVSSHRIKKPPVITPVLSLFGMAFLLGLIFNAAPGAVCVASV